MNYLISFNSAVPLLASLTLISTATAGSSFDMAGRVEGTDHSRIHQIAENYMVIQGMSEGTFVLDNSDNPMNGATGECFGTLLSHNATGGGTGFCTFKDNAGEQFVIEWTGSEVSNGGTQGSWKLNGGTGMWMNATGNGTFLDNPPDAEQHTRTDLQGQLTIQ
jgi:hypothetical protein